MVITGLLPRHRCKTRKTTVDGQTQETNPTTIQRLSNGIYIVQTWLSGKRHVKSLETRDPERAAARAGQAIRELQKEASSGFNRWGEHHAERIPKRSQLATSSWLYQLH